MSKIEDIFNKLNLDLAVSESSGWIYIVPLLKKIQREGATVFIKSDGERLKNIFTVIIEGGRLGGEYIRCETDDLVIGMEIVIAEYAKKFW